MKKSRIQSSVLAGLQGFIAALWGVAAMLALAACVPIGASLPLCSPVAIVAHELGHVMGLKHSSDPQALMAPQVHPCMVVTQGDLEALVEVLP